MISLTYDAHFNNLSCVFSETYRRSQIYTVKLKFPIWKSYPQTQDYAVCSKSPPFSRTRVQLNTPLSKNSLRSVVEAMPLFDKSMTKVADTVDPGTVDSSLQRHETS